ncbi:putative PurR-regulated permease PerM [Kineothrix alysoides]|uniref:Putative PurR-regulated permease PerM n=1 Tax=Kineothrix alysoides TaxID=1469948 RepID=A0A4V2QCK8_9FIRM|nr:AI-2E family transporter [Kineothrix alysoides]TCL60667.1 putative PurR-regulated permease PerM [Kineothrix alysoides]
MDLNRKNVKSIRGLIIFTAFICLAVWRIDVVLQGIFFVIGIIKPFLYGGAIAFVLNIPMGAIEKRLFSKNKNIRIEKMKRPISIVLSFVLVILSLVLVGLIVVPQVTRTLIDLGNKIPQFLVEMQVQLEKLFAAQPQLLSVLTELEPEQLNWDSIMSGTIDFLKNGFGSMLASTVTVASNIIGGVVNLFVALIFSFYILAQKEKLGDQIQRIMQAYFSEKIYKKMMKVFSLAGRTFSSFITGQCTEAIILGSMFVVCMVIFGFPYAVLVGVLIAFTALIPIVGAFIGCFVGAFLIMVDDPIKAVWFLVLFIILQQVEGNLIYPHVVGNSVGLPSIWVLMAVTLGGSLMGVAGMLIFIPIVSTVYSLLREDVNKRNEQKIIQKAEVVKKSEVKKTESKKNNNL